MKHVVFYIVAIGLVVLGVCINVAVIYATVQVFGAMNVVFYFFLFMLGTILLAGLVGDSHDH